MIHSPSPTEFDLTQHTTTVTTPNFTHHQKYIFRHTYLSCGLQSVPKINI